MDCLSNEQLAQVATGHASAAQLAEHLDRCQSCRDRLAHIRDLIRILSLAHDRLEAGHSQGRSRLMKQLQEIGERAGQVSAKRRAGKWISWRMVPSWIGGLSMKQRIALGGVSVAVLAVAALAVWVSTLPRPVSAMEQMARSIRAAKSCAAKVVMEVPLPGGRTAKMTGAYYWLADGSVRMETRGGPFAAGQEETEIFPAGKEGISINHKSRTYKREPARRGHRSPLMMLHRLGSYQGEADRKLGRKLVANRPAVGFAIDARRIDPDGFDGTVEVWLDQETHLPIEMTVQMKMATTTAIFRLTDIRWNVDLDPKLFDPTPPDGYKDLTPKPPTVQEQVTRIVEALKLYAELSGGHYPRHRVVYGDVMQDEMRRMAGFTGLPQDKEQLRKRLQDERWRIQRATRGAATISTILRDNPDAAYYGLTVGPDDKEKILLRWKLPDGHYQVIYGDLRSETVTAERLRELEASQRSN